MRRFENLKKAGKFEFESIAAVADSDECDGVFSGAIFGRRTKSAGKLLGLGQPAQLAEALDQMTLSRYTVALVLSDCKLTLGYCS